MFGRTLKKHSYYIANIVFIVLWTIYTVALFIHPYLGITVNQHVDSWTVTEVDRSGEGFRLGVKTGDAILTVNGVNPGEDPIIKKWRQVEGASLIEILDNGSAKIIKISKQPLLSTFFSESPLILLSLAFWLVGFITWLKRPFILPARVMYWLNWVIALAIILEPASRRHLFWGRELELFVFSLIAPLLVKFITVFPIEQKNRINSFVTTVLFSITFLTVVLLSLKFLGLISITSTQMQSIGFVGALIGTLVVFWNLLSLLRLPADRPEKNQVLIVLIGVSIGILPFVLFTALPIIVNGTQLVNSKLTAAFTVAMPVAFGYVIVKKYLPDGRRLLDTVTSFLVFVILAAVLLSSFLFLTGTIKEAGNEPYMNIFSQTMIVLLLCTLAAKVLKRISEQYIDFDSNKTDNEPNGRRVKQGLIMLNRSLFMNLEGERQALAREIHDGPLQLGLEVSRRLKQMGQEASNHVENLSSVQEIIDTLNYELRSLCTDLRPSTLSDLGLIPAVEALCRDIMKKEFLTISLKINDLERLQRFSEEIELGAFRFVQEGLSNVVRHAGTDHVEVDISLYKGSLELKVADSGRGFDFGMIEDLPLTGKHFGIIGMRERIKGLNGEFNIQTRPGQGVTLSAIIPLTDHDKQKEGWRLWPLVTKM